MNNFWSKLTITVMRVMPCDAGDGDNADEEGGE